MKLPRFWDPNLRRPRVKQSEIWIADKRLTVLSRSQRSNFPNPLISPLAIASWRPLSKLWPLLGLLIWVYRKTWRNSNFLTKTRSVSIKRLSCLQVSSKYGTWFCERIIWQSMCVGFWTGVTYLRYTVLTSPKKDETAVYCWSCFIGSCHVGVSKRPSRSISLAVYWLSFFSADQISCRSYIGSVYRMRSLAVSDFLLLICARSQIYTSIPM